MKPSCDLGVVVVALVGGPSLAACLEGLREIHDRCVAVLGEAMGTAAEWQRRFPRVRFLDAPGLPVPQRRRRGVEMAPGEFIALLEDTSIPDTGWVEAVCAGFVNPQVAAVGGPVRLAPQLAGRFQALGCGEYGRFHPQRIGSLATTPASADGGAPVTRLPGNNLAYRREHLQRFMAAPARGLIESEINATLRAQKSVLWMHPGMSVVYTAADHHNARLTTRFHHGRLFAGVRVAGCGWGRRVAWFCQSLLLPAVLTARAWGSMRYAVRPGVWPVVAWWILLMESTWAVGESVGYLFGAGHSLEEWR